MLWVWIISIAFSTGHASGLVPSFRILGGSTVKIEDYPYMVSVQLVLRGQMKHVCGGTLISPTSVLTAAHCFPVPGYYVVKAGAASLKSPEGCLVPITKVIMHPKYRPLSQDYDIAVAKLRKPVKLSNKINIAKLPPLSKDIPLVEGTVLGWGETRSGYDGNTDALRAVDIPIIDDKECVRSYPKGLVTDRMFCAKVDDGSKDSCKGDSGGPFIINGTIYGIVSWGFDCGSPENPGVYTRVPYFFDFVNNTLTEKISRFSWIDRWMRQFFRKY
ncbi:trypsin-2-like [Coccinella septempunctata]|uniref:trypsin-2-like n=1 Tax=Coccinella septempunctata TaxID=41139 RepID=UPI001D061076|nr:trypsin-2-like [Coccinella septempunctata]